MKYETRPHSWSEDRSAWAIYLAEDSTRTALISGMPQSAARGLAVALSGVKRGVLSPAGQREILRSVASELDSLIDRRLKPTQATIARWGIKPKYATRNHSWSDGSRHCIFRNDDDQEQALISSLALSVAMDLAMILAPADWSNANIAEVLGRIDDCLEREAPQPINLVSSEDIPDA